MLMREVGAVQRSYDQAQQRMGQTEMEARVPQTNIAPLTPAVEPVEPSGPRIILNMLMSVFSSAAVDWPMVTARSWIGGSARLEDISSLVGMPVIGCAACTCREAVVQPASPCPTTYQSASWPGLPEPGAAGLSVQGNSPERGADMVRSPKPSPGHDASSSAPMHAPIADESAHPEQDRSISDIIRETHDLSPDQIESILATSSSATALRRGRGRARAAVQRRGEVMR